MNATPAPLHNLYYDGGCPVCTREIGFYQRRRGAEHIHGVNLPQCADEDMGTDLSREAATARQHARWPDGRLVSGAQAFTALWQTLPAFAWPAVWRRWQASCSFWNGAIGGF